MGRLSLSHPFGDILNDKISKMTSAYYLLLKLKSKILGKQNFSPKDFCKICKIFVRLSIYRLITGVGEEG